MILSWDTLALSRDTTKASCTPVVPSATVLNGNDTSEEWIERLCLIRLGICLEEELLLKPTIFQPNGQLIGNASRSVTGSWTYRVDAWMLSRKVLLTR